MWASQVDVVGKLRASPCQLVTDFPLADDARAWLTDFSICIANQSGLHALCRMSWFLLCPLYTLTRCAVSATYVRMYICVVYTIDGVVGVECCVVNGMQ